MKKISVLLIIMTLFALSSKAQLYYGKDLFGRLKIINDSVCTVTFISWMDIRSEDTCSFRKQGDTLWLSTKARIRYRVNVYDKNQPVFKPWIPVIIKTYSYTAYNKKYNFSDEKTAIYDSLTKTIVLNESGFSEGTYIIAFRIFGEYYRVKCDFGYYQKPERKYLTLQEDTNYFHGVVFNEFPLLVKGNKLIPIDEEKQVQCWLDNGFFFPKMKMSKKHKKYNIINGNYIGLRNLPTKMKGLEKLKPLPRKYIKYLDNAR
ncbi:MAG TPA: hypothetical protein PLW70_01610 [Bacteroidales bacterium]|nr:hypothetical protein [Bacteroidales bacterium]